MNESHTGKENDSKYQVYLDERKSLIKFKFEETRLFDKAIITLAAGALGLSLTFIRQIAPDPKSWTIPILAIAWVSFCLSILSTLVSFLTSQHACSKQVEILEAEYFPENGQQMGNKPNNRAKRCTKFLNWVSIAFFIIGAILLAVFSICNLQSCGGTS